MNIDDIKRLFGAPLSQVPFPKASFQWKPYHTIGALIIIGLTVYGAVSLKRDLKGLFQEDKKDSK